MSDVMGAPDDFSRLAEATEAADDVTPTAGSLLREAREAAGLHIAALAVSLKVPVKKLEALESGRLDQLPDAVFVRALAASVCRTLKIDAAPVLEKLPLTIAPRLTHDQNGINAPFRAPSDGPGPGWREQLTRPVMLLVLALLLGALILIFLPAMQPAIPSVTGNEAVSVTVPQTVPASAMPAAVANPVVSAPVAVSVTATSAVSSPTPASSVAVSVQPVASPTLVISSKLAAPPVTKAPDGDMVVFKATSESWVEVTDAKGQTTLRRILAAGESVSANGALPLAVVVGRANVTEVSVRGRRLELAPLARDNVARFEVK